MNWVELLEEGNLTGALGALEAELQSKPADVELRAAIFQLLCVGGQWKRALIHLEWLGKNSDQWRFTQLAFRPVIECERTRAEVFTGQREPTVIGTAPDWAREWLEASRKLVRGDYTGAREGVQRSLEQQPECKGTINGQPITYLSDVDPRVGPFVELYGHGQYFWLPVGTFQKLILVPPTRYHEMVWAQASVTLASGTEISGFIPTRYPGSETAPDDLLKLARRTEWEEQPEGWSFGVGQRTWMTNDAEWPLLEVKEVLFEVEPSGPAGPALPPAEAEESSP